MNTESLKAYFQRPNGPQTTVLLLAIISAFSLGYYYKHLHVKQSSIAIQTQADNNKNIDKQLIAAMTQRDQTLLTSLSKLGLSDEEISFLYKGEDTKYDQIKRKFTQYLPGKTKFVKADTVYIPREDCVDDYLGVELSNQANDVILQGRNKRQENQ